MTSALQFVPTDVGNAERLVRLHGADFRWVHKWDSFMVFDGTRWARDESRAVERFAKSTLRQMIADAAKLPEDQSDLRNKMIGHAMRSESNGRIVGMVARAKAEAGVAVPTEVFDQHPFLLNVANGCLNLRKGRLGPHDRSHFLTKCSTVRYDPEALCPTWERFLLEVFAGRVDIIDYVQRAVGYSLTGDTSEQCLHLMHGSGSNGKSTFLEVLQALFGDYGIQADFSTFLDGKTNDGPRNDVARLAGARMVRSSEVGEGKRFNESLVKALTGSETIAARFLFSESFEFSPTFKLWFAANHKPVIRGTDHAIWRRVRLLPFDVQFTEEQKDRQLKQKLLAELPGILAWAVAGCLLWQERGLGAPADVQAATEEYRRESDVIGSFLEDSCETGAGLEVAATDLYQAFKRWAKDNGEYELSQTAFGRRLEERGFGTRKSGTKYRLGLRLNAAVQATSQDKPAWFDR